MRLYYGLVFEEWDFLGHDFLRDNVMMLNSHQCFIITVVILFLALGYIAGDIVVYLNVTFV